MSVSFKIPDFGHEKWSEVPENPLIAYDKNEKSAIGDPQVLLPGEFDDQWHIFFHGFFYNPSRIMFFHHVSPDGINWTEKHRWYDWLVGQNYMFPDGNRWILYHTCVLPFAPELEKQYGCMTIIRAKTTVDFETWNGDYDIILPETPEEREGTVIEARNPCMIRLPDGRYRLYYSAGTVNLPDAGYEEPKYIFCAESDNPLGPFVKCGAPILSPDPAIDHRNFACGAIKVYGYGDKYLAFYNPIYIDKENHSRSQINLLASDDGIEWYEAPCNPIITPAGEGWRKAIVYQLDAVTWQDEMRIYFNARDNWRGGIERIGCCRFPLNGAEGVRKLTKTFRG